MTKFKVLIFDCIKLFLKIFKSDIYYLNKNKKKDALISYITHPFKKNINNPFSHTNILDVKIFAEVISDLGFNVTITSFNNNYYHSKSKFDLILGFGLPFEKEITKNPQAIKIYYGTGMHPTLQNINTINRLKNFYSSKGLFNKSLARIIEVDETFQIEFSNHILALGNKTCGDSYRKYSSVNVIELDPFNFNLKNPLSQKKFKNKDCKKGYLWFGSSGSIHKGLDLLLDFFIENDNLEFHVCGLNQSELEFLNEIYNFHILSNIYFHGYVDLNSSLFDKIVSSCMFIIHPSVSEGGSPAILNAIWNGYLYPITTKETCVELDNQIIIEELNEKGIKKAIKKSQLKDITTIETNILKNIFFIRKNYNPKIYKKNLFSILKGILDEN